MKHLLATTALAAALLLGACSSSDDTTTTADRAASTTTTGPGTTTTTAATRSSMRGQRYCEVLVVKPANGSVSADVYNTWPLNDCPAEQWSTLDATAIARGQGAPAAILNGPRYWLMDSIRKDATPQSLPKATFGGLEMYRQANVELGPLADAMTPYKAHAVDRKAAFTFDAGATVFELHAADGSTYLMQTWSQMVDTGLTEGDLADLGSRLQLPAGWTYSSRKLAEPLVLDTTGEPAQVLMDDLRNSYSKLDSR